MPFERDFMMGGAAYGPEGKGGGSGKRQHRGGKRQRARARQAERERAAAQASRAPATEETAKAEAAPPKPQYTTVDVPPLPAHMIDERAAEAHEQQFRRADDTPMARRFSRWRNFLGRRKDEQQEINLDSPESRAKAIAELAKLRGEVVAKQEEIERLKKEESAEIERLGAALKAARETGGKESAEAKRLAGEIGRMKDAHDKAIGQQGREIAALKKKHEGLDQRLKAEQARLKAEQDSHAATKASLDALAKLGLEKDARLADYVKQLPQWEAMRAQFGDAQATVKALTIAASDASAAAERARLQMAAIQTERDRLAPIAAQVPELEAALARLQIGAKAYEASNAEVGRERAGFETTIRELNESMAALKRERADDASELAKVSEIVRSEIIPFLQSNSDERVRAAAAVIDIIHEMMAKGTAGGASDVSEALEYAKLVRESRKSTQQQTPEPSEGTSEN